MRTLSGKDHGVTCERALLLSADVKFGVKKGENRL